MSPEEKKYREFCQPDESPLFLNWWLKYGETLPDMPVHVLWIIRTAAFLAFRKGFARGVEFHEWSETFSGAMKEGESAEK